MSGSRQQNFFHTVNAGSITFGDGSPAHTALAPQVPHRAADNARDADTAVSTALLIVAADIEREATMNAITAASGSAFTRWHIPHHTLYRLGRVSRAQVVLAQIGQGAVTPDAAAASAPALIDHVRPDYVIAVGICYGLREDRQRLGDIVVAKELRLTAHRRISHVEIERGGAVHASPTLIDRFRSAQVDWDNPATVHVGQVISESVLLDSVEYRRGLKERYPEAIGGEMEGAALYTAAMRSKVEWGVVKAICDWGFDKTDQYQKLAADNAASFVAHVLRIGGLDPV